MQYKIHVRRDPNNPLSIPQYGAQGVAHPDVIYFQNGVDGYKFWLYYTPYPPNEKEVTCLVRSNDGLNFVDAEVSNPLIRRGRIFAWDEKWLADPDVVKVDDDWHMFFYGANRAYTHGAIGYAHANDGKSFIKRRRPVLKPTEPWEGRYLAQPAVVYLDDLFWMWYVAIGTYDIGLAWSEDCINWTKHPNNPIIKRGILGPYSRSRLGHPDVIYCKKELWMFLLGSSNDDFQLGLLISKDKENWDAPTEEPVLSPQGNGWEQRFIYRSSPAIVNKEMWLYYSAYAGTGPPARPKIGLAWLDLLLTG